MHVDRVFRHDGVSATLMRGGTSKCWIFEAGELPGDRDAADRMLVRLFGSPDPRQIDGVGGGTSTTSKALLIDTSFPAERIQYKFAQVSIDQSRVEWGGNCGNCASSLALYALQQGLVFPSAPTTRVSLINTETGLVFDADVATPPDGSAAEDVGVVTPGTVYPGTPVDLWFSAPSWSTFGETLPTGNGSDVLTVDGRELRVTLVDAGAPCALVWDPDIEIESLSKSSGALRKALALLGKLRPVAAERMGIPESDAPLESMPKVGVIGRAAPGSGHDLEARMVSMTDLHPSIGVTSAVGIAVAAWVPKSAVSEVLPPDIIAADGTATSLTIGTSAEPVKVKLAKFDGQNMGVVGIGRSARRIADARLCVPGDWA